MGSKVQHIGEEENKTIITSEALVVMIEMIDIRPAQSSVV